MNEVFEKLLKSKFRTKFFLDDKMSQYVLEKGIKKIENDAKDLVSKRIAPKNIPNDGRQTPFKHHPVFIAQHATATCCRKCINKWHKFGLNYELTAIEQDYIVQLIMSWIKNNLN